MNTKMLRQSHGCVGKHQSCTAAFYCLVPRRSGQTTDFRVRQLAPSHSASLRHYWVSGSKGQNKLRANKDKDRNNPKANNKHLKDRQGARRWWCMPLSLAGGSLSLRPLVYRASSRTEDVDGGGGMTWDRGKKHLAERETSSRKEETVTWVPHSRYSDEEATVNRLTREGMTQAYQRSSTHRGKTRTPEQRSGHSRRMNPSPTAVQPESRTSWL